MKILYVSINVGVNHPLRVCVTKDIDPLPDLDLSRILRLSKALKRDQFHQVIDGTLGLFPSDVDDVCGLMIGCSGHSFDLENNEAEPWQEELLKFIRRCIDRGIPYLGLCGGGQAGLVALGGKVRPNPAGTGTFDSTEGSVRMGVSELSLSQEAQTDAILSDIKGPVVMSALHSDHMSVIPDDTNFTVLARDQYFPFQGLRYKDNVWMFGVHPEMTKEFIRSSSKIALDNGGFGMAERGDVEDAFESMQPTERNNALIIENFVFNVCFKKAA